MKHTFNSSFALAGLFCAIAGVSLAGCNGANNNGANNNGGGMTGATSGSSSDTLATVGSSKVTRADLTTFLEAQGGEQALPILIDTQLIFEALKAKSLDVSDAEVEADLAKRQANDPQAAALLAAGGPRVAIIKTQIKRELAVQKLLTAGITATDAQLKTFFEKNRRYYDQAQKVKVGILFASTKVRADLMARQLKAGTKNFAALVAEQQKVNDPAARQSTEVRPSFESLDNFPPAVSAQLAKLGKGAVTTPQSLNVGLPTPVFIIFRKVDVQPAVKADLAKIRAEVETDYKAAEVAKKTVAKNPQNPPFDETLRRSFDSVKAQNPNATLRDTLNFINQTAASEIISGLRTAGTVQIEDANYAKVAAPYQAPGAAAGNTASGNVASGNSASGNSASGNSASDAMTTGNVASENAAPAAGNAAP